MAGSNIVLDILKYLLFGEGLGHHRRHRRSYGYISRRRYHSPILIIIAVIYIILKNSEQQANLFLVVCVAIILPLAIILYSIFKDRFYELSINLAKKNFVIAENTLCNSSCMVKFIPGKSIVVTDNIAERNQYTFTVYNYQVKNLNKCWNDICKIFDDYTYLKMLASYFENFYLIDGKINLVLLKSYTPPLNENKNNNKVINNQNTGTQNSANNTTQTNSHIDTAGLIDINNASADQIAQLPGLNLIMAKKIVDYRNKHGEFTDVDQFYIAGGIKDYFKSKISSLVVINKSFKTQSKNNDNDGRIVDF